MIEKSYVMVKPEFANHENVIAMIKARLQLADLTILKADYIKYDVEAARKHYAEHLEKPFYPDLEKYITSDKAYGMVVSGENAIAKIRNMAGATKNPDEGTIRYVVPILLGRERNITKNVIHSSDSANAAKKEIAIFETLLNKNKGIER